MTLDNKKLLTVTGGATTISGTLLSAVAKLITTVLDVGRAIGSAISMAKSGNKC